MTVIIATFNSLSQSFFRECLASVRKQRYPGTLRIVVVDGGSSDGTVQAAEGSGAFVLHNPATTELGYRGGKNRALAVSETELVSYVDADNILVEDDYFASLARPFEVLSSLSVSIPTPYVPNPGQASSIERYFCRLEEDAVTAKASRGHQLGEWILFRPTSFVIPNGAVIRRSALELIGGFDYDTEVAARLIKLGIGEFALVRAARRYHREMQDLSTVWRKFKRRVENQARESSNKPVVLYQIQGIRTQPLRYLRGELWEPLQRARMTRDVCYLNALPVFGIKSLLGATLLFDTP